MKTIQASLKSIHPRADFCFVLIRTLELDIRLSPESTTQCRVELMRHYRRRTSFRARFWRLDNRTTAGLVEDSTILGEEFEQFIARSENEALGKIVKRMNALVEEALLAS